MARKRVLDVVASNGSSGFGGRPDPEDEEGIGFEGVSMPEEMLLLSGNRSNASKARSRFGATLVAAKELKELEGWTPNAGAVERELEDMISTSK